MTRTTMITTAALNSLTAVTILTWLSLTEYGIFLLASMTGMILLATLVVILARTVAFGDSAIRGVTRMIRSMEHRGPRRATATFVRVIGNSVKGA